MNRKNVCLIISVPVLDSTEKKLRISFMFRFRELRKVPIPKPVIFGTVSVPVSLKTDVQHIRPHLIIKYVNRLKNFTIIDKTEIYVIESKLPLNQWIT